MSVIKHIDKNKLIERLRNERTSTNAPYYHGYNACLDELLDEVEGGRFDDRSHLETIQKLRKERDKWEERFIIFIENNCKYIRENERMKDAIGAAHQSLTWSNTENQVPHAIWHLEQVLNLPQAIVTTE